MTFHRSKLRLNVNKSRENNGNCEIKQEKL